MITLEFITIKVTIFREWRQYLFYNYYLIIIKINNLIEKYY